MTRKIPIFHFSSGRRAPPALWARSGTSVISRILQGRKASVKSGCKICGWRPPAKLHPLFGDHAEMPFDGAPSHLQLICACRCHSQPVPMRRISEDGTRRYIFGGMRVARDIDVVPGSSAILRSDKPDPWSSSSYKWIGLSEFQAFCEIASHL
jgi:hypothetical protein